MLDTGGWNCYNLGLLADSCNLKTTNYLLNHGTSQRRENINRHKARWPAEDLGGGDYWTLWKSRAQAPRCENACAYHGPYWKALHPWSKLETGDRGEDYQRLPGQRHDPSVNAPISGTGTARYVTVVGGMAEFAPVLKESLEIEDIDQAHAVVWVGDGAPCN